MELASARSHFRFKIQFKFQFTFSRNLDFGTLNLGEKSKHRERTFVRGRLLARSSLVSQAGPARPA